MSVPNWREVREEDFDIKDLDIFSVNPPNTGPERQVGLTLRKALRVFTDVENFTSHRLEEESNWTIRDLYKCKSNIDRKDISKLESELLLDLDEKASDQQKRIVYWAFKQTAKYEKKLDEQNKKLEEELRKRNINPDREEADLEKYLRPPEFTGKCGVNSLHFWEFKQKIEEWKNKIRKSEEEYPYILRKSLREEALTEIDYNLRGKILLNSKEIYDILQSKFGNEQKILEEIMKSHEEVGQISSAIDSKTLLEMTDKHLKLYKKATILEDRKPETMSIRYRHSVQTLISRDMMANIIRSKEWKLNKIEAIMTEIKIYNETAEEELRISKTLSFTPKERIKEEDLNEEENFIEDEEKISESKERSELHIEEDAYNYDNQKDKENGGQKCARPDSQNLCSVCAFFKDSMDSEDNIHLFSERGNVETDTCPKIRNLPISLKYELLLDQNFCTNCLFQGNCQSQSQCLPPALSFLKCNEHNCTRRFEVCPDHIDFNLIQLKKRKQELLTFNLDFNINKD